MTWPLEDFIINFTDGTLDDPASAADVLGTVIDNNAATALGKGFLNRVQLVPSELVRGLKTIDSIHVDGTGYNTSTAPSGTILLDQAGAVLDLSAATGTARMARIRADRGSTWLAGELTIGSAFGDTAFVTIVRADDARGHLFVVASGAGIGIGPASLSRSWKDGNYSNDPIVVANWYDLTGVATYAAQTNSVTNTDWVCYLLETPISGHAYHLFYHVME